MPDKIAESYLVCMGNMAREMVTGFCYTGLLTRTLNYIPSLEKHGEIICMCLVPQ